MSELIAHFDSLVKAAANSFAIPTEESVCAINDHFGITLPVELVQFATQSRSYSNFFLSIGPDFESHSHIIRLNSYWRRRRVTRRLPNSLVIATQGFMDDRFWCFDISDSGGSYPLQFWCPEKLEYPSAARPIERYDSLINFITAELAFKSKVA